MRHIHGLKLPKYQRQYSTVGPQSNRVAVKKGITSPSRGLSQHRSHTQDVRRGKKKKMPVMLSPTLLTLFNKWIQTANKRKLSTTTDSALSICT